VIPESCERFRSSVSLALDGMLSTFESRLLERHLETCASCEAFAADVSGQTLQLRAAPLELAPQLADIGLAAPRRARRVATFAAAGVAAAAAAVLSLTPSHTTQQAVASPSTGRALLAVVPSQPTANRNFQLPRLELVSPASADGPVRGYYGVPA
jgi:predicted anti-sigma-YlaC factor YlaD